MILHKTETATETAVPQGGPRIYFFDNLKAILVTLVVFGHVIEPRLWISVIGISYSFIYLFHVPLFVFCTGYFAKYKPKKIITKFIVPYFLIQLAYILFERFVFGNTTLLIQFTRPYWMLWYLLAVIVWMLLLPLIDVVTNSRRNMALTIAVSLILGVVSGFDNTLGQYMSLARIIYFAPFFVIGFCVKKAGGAERLQSFTARWQMRSVLAVLAAGILVWLAFYYHTIDVLWLYGSFSFDCLDGYTVWVRVLCYLGAFVTALFILAITPRRKMFFSYIGQRTMPVFLLHGFIMRLLMKWNFYSIQSGVLLFFASILISLVIVWILSAGLFERAVRRVRS